MSSVNRTDHLFRRDVLTKCLVPCMSSVNRTDHLFRRDVLTMCLVPCMFSVNRTDHLSDEMYLQSVWFRVCLL